MSKIIIYGTKYGSAKRYAEELSKQTNIKAESYKKIKNINDYETIIYIGSIYAGGITGLSKTFRKISNCDNKKIIIATVALSDPLDEKGSNNIKKMIKKQVADEIYNKASIYHLRGEIDYTRLNLVYKTLMKMFCKKLKDIPEEERSADVRAMIDTYNKTVDFVDFTALENIIKEIKN